MSTQTHIMPKSNVDQSARRRRPRPDLSYGKQLAYQVLLLVIAFIVLFPLLWVVSLSLDPRGISRPTELNLIPPGASLAAYEKVLQQPGANKVTFIQLALNSFQLGVGVALFSVAIGVSAAYVFSRFEIRGRRFLMMAVCSATRN